MQLKHLCQRLRRRHGHKPGIRDTRIEAAASYARPNFYYFDGCGRPCWLPLNPAPHTGGKDWAVTEGWPCERYERHYRSDAPHCFSTSPREGDWLEVAGQVRGQLITNEIGQTSDVWNVIFIPREKVARNSYLLEEYGAGYPEVLVFAPDIWMGNTGWGLAGKLPLTSNQRYLYNAKLSGD